MQIHLRLRTLTSLFIVSLLFWGCVASSSKQEEAEALRVAELEERLAKSEETVTDLTHRLSVMQFMVDDHENMLRLSEKTAPPAAPAAATPAASSSPRTTAAAQTPQQAKPKTTAKPATSTKVTDIQDKPAPAASKPAQTASKPAPAPAPAAKATKPSFANPSQLYNYAFATLQEKDYDKASRLFRELADNYPDHPLANNALYWQGECYYAKGDFRTAIIVFEELAERYPKGNKVPDSLLKRAYAYISLGDTTKAKDLLSRLVKNYPDSPAANKADARLKTLS